MNGMLVMSETYENYVKNNLKRTSENYYIDFFIQLQLQRVAEPIRGFEDFKTGHNETSMEE